MHYLYELVDDNDDQDRLPDWERLFQGRGDPSVFPGWDENNDFISDFNQNDNPRRPNLFPDYEEPFLRYSVDRPEFLFGIDMNNNGWIDRFENDEEPDYPYKRDHRGYNVYFGAHIVPKVRMTIGQEHVRLLSADRRNLTTYALFTLDKDYAGLGRFRIFDNFKLAKDNIPDNLFQWVQNELRETFSFILEMGFARRHKGRVFKRTSLGSGIEITFFNQFQDPAPSEFEDDFFGVVWVTQFRNSTAFLGYRLITQSGFRLNRQEFEGRAARTTSTLFFTVFAGIQE